MGLFWKVREPPGRANLAQPRDPVYTRAGPLTVRGMGLIWL